MNNVQTQATRIENQADTLLLQYIFRFSWLMVLVFSGASGMVVGWSFALSVMIGGILVNGSFFLLKGDIEQLMYRVSHAGQGINAVKRAEKIRFVIKFYARLIVLGLLMFVLATKVSLNMVGLAIGLATIMLSVFLVVLSKGNLLYSEQRLGGA